MRRLLIALLVLAALAVGADFGLRYLATSRVASEIQNRLQLTSAPDVSVAGFPFIVQAIQGEYGTVSATLPPQQLGPVSAVAVTVNLHGTRIPLSQVISGNLKALTAEGADATFTVPLASIAAATGVPGLQLSQNGDAIRASATLSVLGQSYQVGADVVVGISSGGITLSDGAISGLGVELPAEVVSALGTLVQLVIPLDTLPFTVDSGRVHVQGGNLVVDATVSNIEFTA